MRIDRRSIRPLGLLFLGLAAIAAAMPRAAAQADDDAVAAAGRLADRLGSAAGPEKGFMLNRTEREAIGAALEGVRAQAIEDLRAMENSDPTPEPARPSAPDIHFGGYVYVGDRAWSAWVNDRAITPETNSARPGSGDLAITGVSPRGVEVLWQVPGSTAAGRRVLQPNQTYLGGESRVIEGRPAPAQTSAPGDRRVPGLAPAPPAAAPPASSGADTRQ